jgi:hypothetical protein
MSAQQECDICGPNRRRASPLLVETASGDRRQKWTVIAVDSGRHAPAGSLWSLTTLSFGPLPPGLNEPVKPAAAQAARASPTVMPIRSGTEMHAAVGAGVALGPGDAVSVGAGVKVGACVGVGRGTGLGDGVAPGGDVRFVVGRGVAAGVGRGVAVAAPDGDAEGIGSGVAPETVVAGVPDPTDPAPPGDASGTPADSLVSAAGTSRAL